MKPNATIESLSARFGALESAIRELGSVTRAALIASVSADAVSPEWTRKWISEPLSRFGRFAAVIQEVSETLDRERLAGGRVADNLAKLRSRHADSPVGSRERRTIEAAIVPLAEDAEQTNKNLEELARIEERIALAPEFVDSARQGLAVLFEITGRRVAVLLQRQLEEQAVVISRDIGRLLDAAAGHDQMIESVAKVTGIAPRVARVRVQGAVALDAFARRPMVELLMPEDTEASGA